MVVGDMELEANSYVNDMKLESNLVVEDTYMEVKVLDTFLYIFFSITFL